jgi:hypothetical protein
MITGTKANKAVLAEIEVKCQGFDWFHEWVDAREAVIRCRNNQALFLGSKQISTKGVVSYVYHIAIPNLKNFDYGLSKAIRANGEYEQAYTITAKPEIDPEKVHPKNSRSD